MTTSTATTNLCPRCGIVLSYLATRVISAGATQYAVVVKRCEKCGCAYGQVTDAVPSAPVLSDPYHNAMR